jgi:FixJ family two-component response regulator
MQRSRQSLLDSAPKEPNLAPDEAPTAYAKRIVDAARQPIAVLDEDMRLLFANSSFLETIGGAPSAGEPLQAMLPALAATPAATGDDIETGAPTPLCLTARMIRGVSGERNVVLSADAPESAQGMAERLREAQARAEGARLFQSRLLIAANHTLRQPLQTISLIHGMLSRAVSDPAAQKLLERLDHSIASLSQMLDELHQEFGAQPPAQSGLFKDAPDCGNASLQAPIEPATDGAALLMVAPKQAVFIVDDDSAIREILRDLLESEGYPTVTFPDAAAFLRAYTPEMGGCLISDARMPGVSGIELLAQLNAMEASIATIIVTAYGDVAMAVRAMKAGAVDFLQKPVSRDDLLDCVRRALDLCGESAGDSERTAAAAKVRGLTERQRQILDMVLAGAPTKIIAADLNLSQRTVDNHRAAIMRRLGAKSLPSLVRIALAGQANGQESAI